MVMEGRALSAGRNWRRRAWNSTRGLDEVHNWAQLRQRSSTRSPPITRADCKPLLHQQRSRRMLWPSGSLNPFQLEQGQLSLASSSKTGRELGSWEETWEGGLKQNKDPDCCCDSKKGFPGDLDSSNSFFALCSLWVWTVTWSEGTVIWTHAFIVAFKAPWIDTPWVPTFPAVVSP